MTATKQTRSQEHVVRIHAPREAVWKALTDAEEITRWYVRKADVDLGTGRYFLHWEEGMEGTARIDVCEAPGRLRLVHQQPVKDDEGNETGELQDAPIAEEYVLETDGDVTVLRMVTSGVPATPEWDGFFDGIQRGWGLYFRALQFYLETHPGRSRDLVEILKMADVPVAEAWKKLLGPDGFNADPAPEQLNPADAYRWEASTGDVFEGTVLRTEAGRVFQGTATDYNGALFSLGVQGDKNAFLWVALGTFGADPDKVEGVRKRLTDMVEKLFG